MFEKQEDARSMNVQLAKAFQLATTGSHPQLSKDIIWGIC